MIAEERLTAYVEPRDILFRLGAGSALASGVGFLVTSLFIGFEVAAGNNEVLGHSEVVGVVAGILLAPFLALTPLPQKARTIFSLLRSASAASGCAWVAYHLNASSNRSDPEAVAAFVWASIFAGTFLVGLVTRPQNEPPSALAGPPVPPAAGPTFEAATPGSMQRRARK